MVFFVKVSYTLLKTLPDVPWKIFISSINNQIKKITKRAFLLGKEQLQHMEISILGLSLSVTEMSWREIKGT